QALDQTLLGQPRERLAQRNVADAELIGQAPLNQAVAGSVLAVPDRGPDPLGDGVRQALIGQRAGGAHAAPYRWMTRPGVRVRSTTRCRPSTTSWTASRWTGSWAFGRSSSVPGPVHASCSTTSAKRLATSSRLTTPSSS